MRASGSDRQFVKNVLSGIQDNRGEQWVRLQFRNHTEAFLKSVAVDKVKTLHRKYLPDFAASELYQRYVQQQAAESAAQQQEQQPGGGAEEVLETLRLPDLGKIEKTKAFYNLDALCTNLLALEQVVDLGGAAVVSGYLGDESAQVRKYAINVLAGLAASVRGILAIAAGGLLGRVVELMKDPMPNVSSAACNCLMQMSQRYTGCLALAGMDDVSTVLVGVVCSDSANLNMKIVAARTLGNLYRFIPSLKRPDHRPLLHQFVSPDRRFKYQVLVLLDQFGVGAPPIGSSGELDAHFKEMNSEDKDRKTEGTGSMLDTLFSAEHLVPEFVEQRGLDILLANQQTCSSDSKLGRVSFGIYTLVANFTFGCRLLVRKGIVDTAIESLKLRNPFFLFSVARFLEVAAQQVSTSDRMMAKGAPEALGAFVGEYWDKTALNTICLPAIGALSRLLVSQPLHRARILAVAQQIEAAVRDPTSPYWAAPGSAPSVDAGGLADVKDELTLLTARLLVDAAKPPSQGNLELHRIAVEAEQKRGVTVVATSEPSHSVSLGDKDKEKEKEGKGVSSRMSVFFNKVKDKVGGGQGPGRKTVFMTGDEEASLAKKK